MNLDIKIINPLKYDGWDELLIANHGYTIFHTSTWARVLYESYHYDPVYFTLFKKNKLSALIPVMEVKSILTGCRGVSLPFSDYCDPIMTERIQIHKLRRSLCE